MRLDVGALTIAVEDHGEALPVVLLHGFPLSAAIWTPIRPAIEQVARLITPDLRGFGESDAPQGEYGMDTLADDIARMVDRLTLDRLVIGGHSMGGYVALAVASRIPERVAAVMLVASKTAADTPAGLAAREVAVETIRERGGRNYLAGFMPNVVGPASRERAPRLLAELVEMAERVPDHVLIACQQGMSRRRDHTALVRELGVPVLIIAGEEDALIPLEQQKALAAAWPRATLAVIPGAGHTPSVERPIATAEAIVSFIRRELVGFLAEAPGAPRNAARTA